MVNINLGGQIYTVEGEDAPLLRQAVAKFQQELDDLKKSAGTLQGKIDTLESEKTTLTNQVAVKDAELSAAKAVNDAAEAAKAEAVKVDGATADITAQIQQRTKLWNEIEPTMNRNDSSFKPNYELNPTEIKVLYLATAYHNRADIMQGLTDRKDAIKSGDQSALLYVDTLYDALHPSHNTEAATVKSNTDSVLDQILSASKTAGTRTDSGDDVDYHAKLTKKIEAAGKN